MCVLMKKCRLVYVVLNLIVIIALASCDDSVLSHMSDVEAFIDNHPDSALVVLESIPHTELTTRRSRAKYALLKSIALDKNYIDVTSDSIIAPAVSYYRHHGSADEKLKTFYYRGIVSFYSNDYDSAMEWFVKGNQFSDEAEDIRQSALLCFKMYEVYDYVFDWNTAFSFALKSSDLFLECKDTASYFEARDCAVRKGLILEKYDTVSTLLSEMAQFKDRIDLSQLSELYASLLQLKRCQNNLQVSDIEEYLNSVSNEELIDWITVANAYYTIEDYNSSLWALEKYDKEYADSSASYNSVMAHSSYEIGDFKRAFEAYSKYVSLIGDREQKSLRSEARFQEERLRKEIDLQKHKNSILVAVFVLIIVILLSIMILLILRQRIRNAKQYSRSLESERAELLKKNGNLNDYFELAKAEIERLKALRKNRGYDKETLMLIRRRFDLLNSIIIGEISKNLKHISTIEMTSFLENKTDFINSNKASYLVSHHEIMEKLIKKGLDDNEIDYCCLYASGMNSQNVADYLSVSIKSVYRTNSSIRAKLKINSNESSLPTIINRMFSLIRD